ncbi:MAG: hypothetical protein FVQ80_11180 [Planctomycetes bacterium]|nr:hypothetical protein [Planctomycetota bacterium]
MSRKKDREDEILDEILAKIEKERRYDSVRSDHNAWWLRCLGELGNEGKITRDEVFAIVDDTNKREGRIG